MGILPEERDDFSYLKPSASVPTFIGRVMSHSLLGEPLIPPMRRVSTTDKLYIATIIHFYARYVWLSIAIKESV